ncbi:hypothetical protein DI392_06935 [Vibrio albus]|uniref:UPF0225 protein DI392_06935 n=1 Tax=Vibrio albus TaxID=2200953 RepID=A0A2U3BAW6_9VIBR|nr:YchJ family metal-binding protein [Vibrio albus]PWI33928.1 hypothetical protein DI392_06935 [Vibrio albus]
MSLSLYPEGSLCPCGSNKPYSNCCLPIHTDHKNAVVPEQLMRARYCAHVLKLPDFVISTYHPSCSAESEREGIIESINLDWIKLEVLDTPTPQDTEGFVEFKAYLQDEDTIQCMHERSRFVKENGLWYYIDGAFPEEPTVSEPQKPHAAAPKVGRNDPCPCGSGKKYKKCCG